jgi:hypothetical protein
MVANKILLNEEDNNEQATSSVWIIESNIIRKRPAGKPRKRWVNAVEIDSTEILKVRNWKRESLDRYV